MLIEWRTGLLILSILLGILALPLALRLQFDRSLEHLFHHSDPRLANYLESNEIFGAQEACFVAYSDPELISVKGLCRLEALAAELTAVPGIDHVINLAQMRRPSAPLSAKSLRQMLEDGKVTANALRDELTTCDLYRGRLISADGQTTAIVVTLSLLDDKVQSRAETIQRMREVASKQPTQTLVTGSPVMVDDVFRHLENDGQKLGIYSTLIMSIAIAIMFRNIRWMLLPLVVVHLALLWTKAAMVLSGLKLSMVSSPMVALVTVIGVSTVVHFAVRYREYRSQYSPENALRGTLSHIGPATFWTIFTTMGGFLSLMVCRIVPVQSFGLMMGVGTMFVFVAILGLLPGSVLIGRVASDPMQAPGEDWVGRLLGWMRVTVQAHPWLVTIAGLVVVLFLSIGTTRLESATNFSDNFRDDSPIVQSYAFVAERLGPTGYFDLVFDAPTADDPGFKDFLLKVSEAQKELHKIEGVAGSMSIPDLIQFIKGEHGAQPKDVADRFAVSVFSNLAPREQIKAIAGAMPSMVSSLWNQERNVMKISVLTLDLEGNQAKYDRLAAVEEVGKKHFSNSRASGAEILIMFLVSSMLSDQWATFGVAIAAIVVMLALAFRSIGLALVALVPNVAPILIVIGTMGWLGLKLNMATAMLASVSLGMCVDFSIHYVYRFRLELCKGTEFYDAMGKALGTVGIALVLSNVALVTGFMVLTLSEFVPTSQFGYLVSVVMLGGLGADLIVMPLLMQGLRVVWPSSFDIK